MKSVLTKGGEGSRGGVVIGHTRSGAPVYQDHKPESTYYRPFLPGDHASAALLHEKAAAATTDAAASLNHRNLASAHRVFYEKAVARSRKPDVLYNHSRGYKAEAFARSRPGVLSNLAKAEGDRGAVVIGHTSSGRPVYLDQHAGADHYQGFKSADHCDASRMHDALSNKLKSTDEAGAMRHSALRYAHIKAAMRLS